MGNSLGFAVHDDSLSLKNLPVCLSDVVVEYMVETEASIFQRAADSFVQICPTSTLPCHFCVDTEDRSWDVSVCSYPQKASLEQIITFLKSKKHRWVKMHGVRILDCDRFHLVDLSWLAFYVFL